MGWIADLLLEIPTAARYKAQLEAMENENTSLRAENSRLSSELEALRDELAVRNAPADGVHQDAERILDFIGSHENTTAPQIANAVSMAKGVVDMHLVDLRTSKHIDAPLAMNQEPPYYLTQTGRRYLHAKGLL